MDNNKLRPSVLNHRKLFAAVFFVLPFCLLLKMNHFSVSGIEVSNKYYIIHYLYNYSKGYIGRGFVGHIISLFFDKVSDELIVRVIYVMGVILALAVSCCIGKVLLKSSSDSKTFIAVSCLVIITVFLPYSLRSSFADMKLDKLLWAIALFAVLLSQTRVGKFFVPLFCSIGMLVNPVFLFECLPLIAIILLQNYYLSGYKKTDLAIGVTTALLVAGIFVLAAMTRDQLGFADTGALFDYYFSRYEGAVSDEFRQYVIDECLFDYYHSLPEMLRITFSVYFNDWGSKYYALMNTLFYSLPLTMLFSIFWFKAIRQTKNGFQKLIYYLCMLFPVFVLPAIIGTWETGKYFAYIFIVDLCLIIYYLANKKQEITEIANNLLTWCTQHYAITLLAVGYFSFV